MSSMIPLARHMIPAVTITIYSWKLFCFVWFWKLDERTTCVKIVIITGRDCESTEGINKFAAFLYCYIERLGDCRFKTSRNLRTEKEMNEEIARFIIRFKKDLRYGYLTFSPWYLKNILPWVFQCIQVFIVISFLTFENIK